LLVTVFYSIHTWWMYCSICSDRIQ